MKWVEYEEDKGSSQRLPLKGRYVLVQIASRPSSETLPGVVVHLPPAVAVGYLRFAAGDRNCPNFIVPGIGGEVVGWCDCLGDDFHAPLWRGKQVTRRKK